MSVSQIKRFALLALANFLYLTGLSLLVPLSIVFVFLPFVASGALFTLAVIAGVLIATGTVILFWSTGSKRRTLFLLGRTTLIPAALSIILSFVNEQLIFSTVAFYVEDFQRVEPVLTRYLERTVPHGAYLTVGYVAIGALLLWRAQRTKK